MWARLILGLTTALVVLVAVAVSVDSYTLSLLAVLGAVGVAVGLLAVGLAMAMHYAWTRDGRRR